MKTLEKLIYASGLMLDESEAIELGKIDRAMQPFPPVPALLNNINMAIRGAHLRTRREKTLEIYRRRIETREALENAIASDANKVMWNKAYHTALTTNKLEQSLYIVRLKDIESQAKELFLYLKAAWTIGLVIRMISLFFDEKKDGKFGLRILMHSSIADLIQSLIEPLFTSLSSLFIHKISFNALINDVLHAAKNAGVELRNRCTSGDGGMTSSI